VDGRYYIILSIIIDNSLSTAGISEGTYQFLRDDNYQPNINSPESWKVVDVRRLSDDDSNSIADYQKYIDLAIDTMIQYGKAVICCSYGISRSNAIAVGVLVKHFKMDFNEAIDLVKKKVGRANIKEVHLTKLKELFGDSDKF